MQKLLKTQKKITRIMGIFKFILYLVTFTPKFSTNLVTFNIFSDVHVTCSDS